MAADTKVTRVVRGVFATYTSIEENELGDRVAIVRTADRGQEVELSEREVKRLDALGALAPEGATPADVFHNVTATREAFEQVYARALNPYDTAQGSPPEGPPTVSPPSLGQAPRGDFTEGDTGIEDTPATPGAAAAGAGVTRLDAPDPRSADVAALAEWISAESPRVDETVALAEGDPALATKVLEAENVATGGDPRKGVEDALGKIAETGGG